MRRARIASLAAWAYVGAALAFLFLPLVPPLLFSLVGEAGGVSFRWYRELGRNPVLTGAVGTSLIVAVLVAVITPLLGLLAAMAVRELRMPRLIMMLVLLPLFIPGISMGLATAFLFRQLGIAPSLVTITVVHVTWALPFATLVILTVMATFDPVYLEAAYMHGANRLRAFLDIELPLIWPGISGAGIFAAILSFNETVRTALVQGPLNTVQTYIWSTYLQVGLSPTLHALMALLILATVALVVAFILVGRGRAAR
jgi:ABC-type spermidine/putrescine transport system permease subunit II